MVCKPAGHYFLAGMTVMRACTTLTPHLKTQQAAGSKSVLPTVLAGRGGRLVGSMLGSWPSLGG